MRLKFWGTFLLPVFLLGTGIPCLAGMESENYRITTSVISGGGGAMGSASYRMNSTLGQSSPLMDPANPPYSESYDLYPGYWYTVGLGTECFYDLDGDRDVDGKDLADFSAGFETEFEATELEFFAGEFGRHDCGSGTP